MNRIAISALVVGFGLMAGAAYSADQTPAPAGDKAAHEAFKAACGEDVKKFCADKSKEERHTCVEANKSKFSQTCQTYMKEHPWHPKDATTPAPTAPAPTTPAPH